MTNGPCLCGDPACGRCGNPEQAAIEAAESGLLDVLAGAGLTVDEYGAVGRDGLRAVLLARDTQGPYDPTRQPSPILVDSAYIPGDVPELPLTPNEHRRGTITQETAMALLKYLREMRFSDKDTFLYGQSERIAHAIARAEQELRGEIET
jgi:hypothetical protein